MSHNFGTVLSKRVFVIYENDASDFFIFFMVCKSQNNFTQNFLDTYMLVIRKKELLFVKSYGAHCSLQNRDVNKLTNKYPTSEK